MTDILPGEGEEDLRFARALSRMSEFVSHQTSFGEKLSMDGTMGRSRENLTGEAAAQYPAGFDSALTDPFGDNFDLIHWIRKRRAVGDQTGFKVLPVTITVRDLEVFGDKVSRRPIPTVLSPIMNIVDAIRTPSQAGVPNRRLISKFSGFLAPGEMTLVLGRPGAGCSTLLRTLAGVSGGLSAVNGEVFYNGIDQGSFTKKYASYISYNPEDDLHYPTLTVRETLRFALECRIGSALSPGEEARRQLIEERLQVYLRVFGLLNCADTKVGNELVRGCSGGEKKRVSIAEQLCINASVGFWDGSTKGLDASTALDFVRALRVLTDLSNQAQVVSIYQASEDIYKLFDNVILVAGGHVIYFGPGSEAKAYFESIGFYCPQRKVLPDFLTGITDLFERDVKPGWEDKVPNTVEEYEQKYKESKVYARMMDRLRHMEETVLATNAADNFCSSVVCNKQLLGQHRLVDSEYSTTIMQQFRAVCKREAILMSRDIATVGILTFDAIMGIIVGFIFFQCRLDSQGAFARGGAIIFSILYMCFNSLASVPMIISGRPIQGKHKAFHLYRTHIQTLCVQLTNMPPILITAVLWSVSCYWLVGLREDAAAFFSYVFTLFLSNQAFGSLVRIIGCLMPDLNTAMMMNMFLVLACVTFSGYIIPKPMMQEWCKFLFWVDPLQWATRALIQIEFSGIEIPCDGAFVPGDHPSYSGYSSEYHACGVYGARVGDEIVRGNDYIASYYDFDQFNLYWNWLILLGYIIVFFCGLVAVNLYFGAHTPAYAVNVWKRRRAEAALREGDPAAAVSAGPVVATSETELAAVDPRDAAVAATAAYFSKNSDSFTWKHVNYTVTLPSGEKRQLLNDVQGFVRAGQMVALMGSSGAGKTTLIDCITQRKTSGDLDGQIYVGKVPQGEDFRTITAYCEQMDVHNSFSTIRETVRFAARLRQDANIPEAERMAFADQVMTLLELDTIADALVGRPNSANGISMEERKRLTIACELAAKPKILFLDEPTSGLDSQAAFTIIRLLRNLADRGQAILCTIHQPSAVIFEKFDSLLLLARGGLTVYFGAIGQDCNTIIGHFEKHGAPKCPRSANPAEYMLECIGAGVSGKKPPQDWVKIWRESPEASRISSDIDEIRGTEDAQALTHRGTNYGSVAFKLSELDQVRIVWARMMTTFTRNPNYILGRALVLIAAGAFIGFSFWDTPQTTLGIQLKLFAIFQAVTFCAKFISLSQPNFYEMRQVFLRERETGVYSWRAFYVSIVSCEWPFVIASTVLFFPLYYYLSGLSLESDRAWYFVLASCLFNLYTVSVGQMVISALPSVQMAAAINPMVLAIQLLTAGVAQPLPSLPKFWHWIYWVNPFHYHIEGIIANEVGNRPIACDPNFASPFLAPEGMTCGEYMADFFRDGGIGALFDPNATGICQYCTFADGNQVLTHMLGDWKFEHRYRNFGFMCAFWAFNTLAITFFIRMYKVSR